MERLEFRASQSLGWFELAKCSNIRLSSQAHSLAISIGFLKAKSSMIFLARQSLKGHQCGSRRAMWGQRCGQDS